MSDELSAPIGPYEQSPVPSDRDLLPGELPFTAWGQHPTGWLDLRVFDQGVWWVDVHQHPHRIDEMSSDYRTNVISYLEERDEYFYHATRWRLLIEDVTDVCLGRLPGTGSSPG